MRADRRGEGDVVAVRRCDPADGQANEHVPIGGRKGSTAAWRPRTGPDPLRPGSDRRGRPVLERGHQVGREVLDLEQPGGAEGGPTCNARSRGSSVNSTSNDDLEREPARGRRALPGRAQECSLARRRRLPRPGGSGPPVPTPARRVRSASQRRRGRAPYASRRRDRRAREPRQVGGVIVDCEDRRSGLTFRRPNSATAARPRDRDHLHPRDAGVIDEGHVDKSRPLALEFGNTAARLFGQGASPSPVACRYPA